MLLQERIFVCDRNKSKAFQRVKGEQKDLKCFMQGMSLRVYAGAVLSGPMNPVHSKPCIKNLYMAKTSEKNVAWLRKLKWSGG